MHEELNIPAEVIAEIQANRKVNAIKLLRVNEGIGLKEAKEKVDAYMDSHPHSAGGRSQESRKGSGNLFLVAMLIVAAYALYRYLS